MTASLSDGNCAAAARPAYWQNSEKLTAECTMRRYKTEGFTPRVKHDTSILETLVEKPSVYFQLSASDLALLPVLREY